MSQHTTSAAYYKNTTGSKIAVLVVNSLRAVEISLKRSHSVLQGSTKDFDEG